MDPEDRQLGGRCAHAKNAGTTDSQELRESREYSGFDSENDERESMMLGRLGILVLALCLLLAGRGVVQAQDAEPRYLLFWAPPERVSALAKTVREQGHGRTRMLAIGITCSTFAEEKQVSDNIHRAFNFARKHNIALMLHFDFHVEWSNRPDLWNWFDPKKPGYNPSNRQNVEWFGWDGPPAKARYLNWGETQRMPPPMCLTSKAIRAEWARLIRDVIAPSLKKELAALEREGKGRLFAGILVGSESTFDNYTHTDPETAKVVAADGAPTGQLGYRALLDRGYSKDHPPADIHKALGEIIQETVAFWCKAFVQSGLPARKLYPHIPAGANLEMTSAPIEAAFNAWSRPGWSTYPVDQLAQNFQPLYDALKKHGSPPWGGVAANVGIPGADRLGVLPGVALQSWRGSRSNQHRRDGNRAARAAGEERLWPGGACRLPQVSQRRETPRETHLG